MACLFWKPCAGNALSTACADAHGPGQPGRQDARVRDGGADHWLVKPFGMTDCLPVFPGRMALSSGIAPATAEGQKQIDL